MNDQKAVPLCKVCIGENRHGEGLKQIADKLNGRMSRAAFPVNVNYAGCRLSFTTTAFVPHEHLMMGIHHTVPSSASRRFHSDAAIQCAILQPIFVYKAKQFSEYLGPHSLLFLYRWSAFSIFIPPFPPVFKSCFCSHLQSCALTQFQLVLLSG